MKRLSLSKIILSSCLSVPLLIFGFATAAQSQTPPPVLITETQTGGINADGTEDAKAEFVELYNSGSAAVNLDGWRVEFLTKTHDGIAAPTRVLANLSGTIEPASFVIISYDKFIPGAQFYFSGGPSSGYLAKGDGTVRLKDAQGATADIVGWGSPNNYAGQPAVAASSGFSLQRCFGNGAPANTSNNHNDFAEYASSPGTSIACPMPEPPDTPTVPDSENPPPVGCHHILITELLPNPAGSDNGHEFIEIHNPTPEPVPLQGCSLQTSANTKLFNFGMDDILLPGEYRSLYNTTTGLTLPNTSGGTVWLLSPNQELQSITYAAGLADDAAWALFDGQWAVTYIATPSAANQLADQKPCAPGQERNTATGRCATPAAATQPQPCKEGQERNPATNRCRSVITAAAEPKPCTANQIRNPQTNRCKAADAHDEPTACAEGQERNPQTNRCRKTMSASDAPAIYDIPAAQTSSTAGLWLAGAGVAGALSYGAYEWRTEIAGRIRKIKSLFSAAGDK